MRPLKRIITAFFLSILLMFAPVQKSYANAEPVGWWVGAGFTSLLYTPVKTAFALLMGITGGLSMMATVPAGDADVSSQIVRWGMYGDWLIRPDHLQGYSPVKFVGTTNRMRFVQLKSEKNLL
ncbi:MAG: hypothetical protein ACKE51_03760 [Methylococcaceae bacterium]